MKIHPQQGGPTPDAFGDTGSVDEVLSIAVEHIAFCLGQGWQPYDVFAAIEKPAPLRANWNDAIWAIAKEQDLLDEMIVNRARRAAAAQRGDEALHERIWEHVA